MRSKLKKKIFMTSLVLGFLIFLAGFYVYYTWSPHKIITSFLQNYKSKYPHLSFSLQDYDMSFNGKLIIKLEEFVVSDGKNMIMGLDRASLQIPVMTVLKGEGLIIGDIHVLKISLDLFKFLEKEFNNWFKRFTYQYDLSLNWKKVSFLGQGKSLEADNGSLAFLENREGNKKLQLSSSFYYKGKHEVWGQIKAYSFIEDWFRVKAIRVHSQIQLQKIWGLFAKSYLPFKQVINTKIRLNDKGHFDWEMGLEGSFMNGDFHGALNAHSLRFNKVNLDISSQYLQLTPKGDMTGHLLLNGPWFFSILNKKIEGNLLLNSQNLVWEIEGEQFPINVTGQIQENLKYQFLSFHKGLNIEAEGNLDLRDFSRETQLNLSSEEKKEIKKEHLFLLKKIWEMDKKKSAHYFLKTFLNDVYLKGKKLSGKVVESWDKDKGFIQVVDLRVGQKGFVKGRLWKTHIEEQCYFDFSHLQIEDISWLLPKSWNKARGQITGKAECEEKGGLSFSMKSPELYLPLFSINPYLKKKWPRKNLYKDDRFSHVSGLWKNKKLETLRLKNRKYHIKAQRKDHLFQLELKKSKIFYKMVNNKWIFERLEQ